MPPETEVRCCRIMTQVVAWGILMDKAVTVNDGSTPAFADEDRLAWGRAGRERDSNTAR